MMLKRQGTYKTIPSIIFQCVSNSKFVHLLAIINTDEAVMFRLCLDKLHNASCLNSLLPASCENVVTEKKIMKKKKAAVFIWSALRTVPTNKAGQDTHFVIEQSGESKRLTKEMRHGEEITLPLWLKLLREAYKSMTWKHSTSAKNFCLS